MSEYRRAAIADHLAAAAQPGEVPRLAGAVGHLPPLMATANLLNQVVNRSQADVHRFGHVDADTAVANGADFARVREHLRVLELGLETGKRMLAAVEAQPGVKPPPPKPEPKSATRKGPADK